MVSAASALFSQPEPSSVQLHCFFIHLLVTSCFASLQVRESTASHQLPAALPTAEALPFRTSLGRWTKHFTEWDWWVVVRGISQPVPRVGGQLPSVGTDWACLVKHEPDRKGMLSCPSWLKEERDLVSRVRQRPIFVVAKSPQQIAFVTN